METPSESQKFDAVMRKILSVSKDELKKREKAWKRKRARKSGRLLSPLSSTLPPSGPCLGSPCSIRFASELSESDALSDDLPDGKVEAASVIKFFSVVEAKHLFIKITEQMERLYRNVSSRNAALQQRPEILKPVCMHAPIYILSRMVHDLMSIFIASPS